MFNVANDFSESRNLAAQNPAHLGRMKALWQEEWDRWVAQPLRQPADNICALNTDYSRATMSAPDR